MNEVLILINVSKSQVASLNGPSTTSCKARFECLEKEDDFVHLNNFLSDKSFISGYTISRDDIIVSWYLENYSTPARLEEILKQHNFRYLL